MLRLLIILAVLIGFIQPTAKEPHRNALQQTVARRATLTAQAKDLVRTRFALAAAAAACGHSDSLFGYNLLLDKFDDHEKTLIAAAAEDGTRRAGRTAKPNGSCATAYTSLGAADDQLILLAEHIGQEAQ